MKIEKKRLSVGRGALQTGCCCMAHTESLDFTKDRLERAASPPTRAGGGEKKKKRQEKQSLSGRGVVAAAAFGRCGGGGCCWCCSSGCCNNNCSTMIRSRNTNATPLSCQAGIFWPWFSSYPVKFGSLGYTVSVLRLKLKQEIFIFFFFLYKITHLENLANL